MKFYLTKAAQLEAEGKAPKAAKPEKAAKPAKATKGLTVPAESTGRRAKSRAADAASSFAPPAVVSAPVPPVASLPSAVASTPVAGPVTPPVASAPVAAEKPFNANRVLKAPKDQGAPKAPKSIREPRNVIAIGGQPRVDLLPQEVRNDRRAAHNVRRAWAGVAAVAVLAVIATGAATLYSSTANSALNDTQGQTSSLIAQQGKYAKVKTIQSAVELMKAGQSVGGSTEIDWNSYLAKVQGTLPYTVTVTAVDLTSSSPLTAYAQSTSPLLGTRVATLTFTATSTALPSVPTWLDGLRSLPGYADATAGSVTYDSTQKTYTANVTMHINQAAYSGRFNDKKGN